ncbi:MAG: glycosyltransferase family 4 protein [Candidatus Absconditabacterales bacterium]|nr:glycosyltransferase family 4 protein [Candidatus Absconditabacterales bacterium]
MKNKIILIHNIITPTRTLLFNKLHEKFKSQGYDFKIIFTSETESNRKWNTQKEIDKFEFDYEILNSKQIQHTGGKDNHFFHINFDIKKILDKEMPNIIIHAGWAGLSAWSSMFWCKKNNAKYILWNESTKHENSWRRTITKPLVKYLVKNSDKYMSFGSRSFEYLEILGANKEKIYPLYNTVDVDFFLEQSKILKPQKEELKQKYGIKTKYTIVFVGQLIERKGIYNILEGFANFQKQNKDISLVFVGGGPEEENMKQIIKEKNIQNVFFPGFFQIDKISELYTIADIFTLPSIEEVWGLVINEAMCFGLPIITAYRVGASADLVQEGKNGFIMKENTVEEFEKGLEFLFENNLIEKNNNLEIIKDFRVEKIVEKLEF